ncbi:MAG: EamA family transporter [Clostridia bacterium]|nr:EamA family transporter [Clostridia bacterium]
MKASRSIIYILLAGILWGSSCIFVNYLHPAGFSPIQCTAIRMVSAAVILNLAVIIKGRGFKLYKLPLRALAIAAASGILSVLSMCIFYYYCMIRTTAAVSAILLYTAPFFVMIMSLIFFGEKLSTKKIAVFITALVGCALASGIVSGISGDPLGIFFGVLSGLSYSLYGIFASFYMKYSSDSLTYSALNFIFAATGALFLANPVKLVEQTVAAPNTAILIGLFIIFGVSNAVLPFLLYTSGLKTVRPDVASILAFSEPLTAAVLGIVALRQPYDGFQLLGIALVTIAIIALNLKRK